MAVSLLINTVDQHPKVSTLYETCIQRGDVISIKPEGFPWDQYPLVAENANFVHITADITEIEADALIEPGRPGEPQYRNRIGINPDNLVNGMRLTRDELKARIF